MNYAHELIAQLPMPRTWSKTSLTQEAKNSIKINKRRVSVYDPRAPETESEIMDTMTGPLLPLYLCCVSHNIKSVNHLMKAPDEITNLVRDPNHRPAILKYLIWRRDNWDLLDPHGVPRM